MKDYLMLLVNISFLVTWFYTPKTQIGTWVAAIVAVVALIVDTVDIINFIFKSRKRNE
ncbi:hypothetical protein [Lactobacillus crispatus]|jgi:hypothetical protein|nr:hypothetical protein [Lactobacillus crispatus]STX16276.1 Uncharacterised protein [Lactobacillus acidophilus]EEJ69753.1 hypothetical protein HMPREF0506_1152 [Lactobacillus crispatus JV-V01]EEU27725.1 hypothetical protein HMPREF0507_01899 [Lactobacillus crispatus MV-1A-US]KXI11153.1 hypothetical protein HMPREF3209_02433 [Lactobacillus crispatus]MBG0733107.1 hypothetical protein [Lactobacillus crispatus]